MLKVELFVGDQTALVIMCVSIVLIVNFPAETVEFSLSKLGFINVPTFVNHPSDAMELEICYCSAAVGRVIRCHEIAL